MAASLVCITKVCGDRSCHCYRGRKHVAYRLTYKIRGQRSCAVHVPLDLLEEVRSWVEEHRRLKRLLQEISQLTLALVRGHAQAQKRRRGRVLKIGALSVRTIRHFFPEFNAWMDAIPDPRFQPFVVYHKRFLLWWGLSLFLCKLGSRRQLDCELDAHVPRSWTTSIAWRARSNRRDRCTRP